MPQSPGKSDVALLESAIEISRSAPASASAFSVGCIIARRDGTIVSSGFSREWDGPWHAEEVALEKARREGADLAECTLYSSLEPCSDRASGVPCATHIVNAHIARVVFAMREPTVFVDGKGAEVLAEHGTEVVEVSELASEVAMINAHLKEGA